MIIIKHWVDASVILGVVILNSLIGFIQEAKAEKALNSIRSLLSLKASVYRDNIGKISSLIAKTTNVTTPLLQKIS